MYGADALHPNPVLTEKLQRLYSLHRGKTIDLSFRPPYLELLARFGNPHLKLPPVIHVAGTNGKGSVIAFMRAILEAAGYRVHVYTSPHLVRFNERIVLAGQTIGDAQLEALLDEAVTLNDGGALTFFEVTTAMAFAAFARHPADILLLEVGLGGRLDCTNVVQSVAATVIMPIGYDHMEFLGDTLAQIAREKAGIMKSNCPCIVAPQSHPVVTEALKQIATERTVPISFGGLDWSITAEPAGRHIVHTRDTDFIIPEPSLFGQHQISNAATAIRVLHEANGFSISQANIIEGVTCAIWPGRLQPLHIVGGDHLASGTELWLDGGHNIDAAQILANQLAAWKVRDKKPLHVIVAMLDKRDPQDFLRCLLPYADSFVATTVPDEAGSHPAQVLREAALRNNYPDNKIIVENEPFSIIKNLAAEQSTRILVCGSFYLIGYILRMNEKAN